MDLSRSSKRGGDDLIKAEEHCQQDDAGYSENAGVVGQPIIDDHVA